MKKRILISTGWPMLLVGVGVISQPGVFECHGTQFRHEVYQKQSTNHPLVFVCNGELYSPPLSLSGTNVVLDRSSVESVAANYYTALKNNDSSLFNKLYEPNEQTTSLEAGPNDRVGAFILKEKVNYGNFTIIIFEGSFNNLRVSSCLAIKKIGDAYYLTDILIEDRCYNYFKNILQEPGFIYQTEVNASTKNSACLREEIYPFTNSTVQPPIVVEYSGTNYGRSYPMPSLIFDRSNQNLSSPETANLAAYAAAFNTNLDWYSSLINPDELEAPFQTISGISQTLKNVITKEMLRSGRVLHLKKDFEIFRVIYFGQYAFVATQSAGGGQDVLTFKTNGKQWLLTDELNREGNMVRNFILGAPSPDTIPFYPKVLPP
jgi:hypothetical protein